LELRTSVVWFILFQSASSPGFDTIFQIQEPLGPVPKHGPVSGTHCTLSKVRNCIGIKFYNQLKLRFVIYQIFYLQNSTFLLTFQKKSSILLEKLAMFWRIFIHESRFSFDYCKRPISQSDPSLTFHLERSQFRSGPYELEVSILTLQNQRTCQHLSQLGFCFVVNFCHLVTKINGDYRS